MIAVVETVGGAFEVDLESDEVRLAEARASRPPAPALSLPRVVDAAASGSTVVAVVDAKPPLLVSYDAGVTWRESGRGLPPGVAVAVGDDPDVVLFAARNRLYLSRDGGVFWSALALELPEIRAVALTEG
ncbi:MAG TPA: hypothetical protein VFA19_15445 [Gaiellaceae bacterium]|nr:hypothetical protein [Gaiellaceae bacterium]